MTSIRYVVGLLLATMLPPAIVWWYVVHPFVRFWRWLGPRTAMSVISVLGIAGAVALFGVRDVLMGRDLGTHWVLLGLGVVLGFGAAWIAVQRKRHLTFGILAGVPELEAGGRGGKLLTEGPYAVVRHPRYIEVVLGMFAYAVFSNYSGVYLLALACLPALHLVVLLEERELSDRFGEEYEAYRARVPRYLPRPSSASAPHPETREEPRS